jgi:hypothetical protein
MLLVLLGAGALLSGLARLYIGESPAGGPVRSCVTGAVVIAVGFAIDRRTPKPPKPPA